MIGNPSVAIIVLVGLFAPAAPAMTGTITGSIIFDDAMGQQCSGSNCQFTDTGSSGGVPAIRVRLLGGFGQTIGEGQTGSNGAFTINWDDAYLWSFPSSGYKLRVTSENTGDWRVTNASDQIYGWESSVTLTSSSQSVGQMDLDDDESANVFATVYKFWNHIVNQSSVLSARMTSIRVSVNVTNEESFGCPANISCSPTQDHAVIVNQQGFSSPITATAHELGHLATAHGLDVWYLNYGIEWCDAFHSWGLFKACEKVIWHEGLANFFATAVMWSKNAPDSSVIFGSAIFPVGNADTPCQDSNDNGEGFEDCQTAAFWDMYDDPSSDDDDLDDSQTDVNIATIVNILDQFTSGTANREADEYGEDGRNHWDFLENLDDLMSESVETDVREIFQASDLCDGEEPYGSC